MEWSDDTWDLDDLVAARNRVESDIEGHEERIKSVQQDLNALYAEHLEITRAIKDLKAKQ